MSNNSNKLISINDGNFDTEVLQSNIPVLVKFGAEWCGPCHRQTEVLEKLYDKTLNVKICSVDVDESPELSSKFNIRGVPTLILFKAGKPTSTRVGLTAMNVLESDLNK